MKREFSVVITSLVILLSFLSSIPLTSGQVSQPLVTATSTQMVSATISYPKQLVQPRIQPTYKFTTSGASYFGNNIGDNVSLTPSITGFSPTLAYNSTLMQYSATFSGCTITIQYNNIQSLTVKQNVIGSNCPVGTYKFNIANLKGFTATSTSCQIQYKSIRYSWCNDKLTGLTIAYSAGVITITATSKNWSIDPTIVQNATSADCGVATTCSIAFASNVAAGNLIIVTAGWLKGLGNVAYTISISDTLTLSYTSAATTNPQNAGVAISARSQVFYTKITSGGADTVTATVSSAADDFALQIYEVSGITSTGLTSATGSCASACGTALSTSSLAFSSGAFLIAAEACAGSCNSMTAGTGFTFSGFFYLGGEYATSGIASPTTFPMTAGSAPTGVWADVGVQFPASFPILVSWNINPTLVNAGEIILNAATTILSSSTITYTALTTVTISAIPFGGNIFQTYIEAPRVAAFTEYNPTNTWTISPSATTTETTSVTASFSNSIATAGFASTASTATGNITPVVQNTTALPLVLAAVIVILIIGIAVAVRRRR